MKNRIKLIVVYILALSFLLGCKNTMKANEIVSDPTKESLTISPDEIDLDLTKETFTINTENEDTTLKIDTRKDGDQFQI